MTTFSERNGYTKLSEGLIKEKFTPELQNAICNCYDQLCNELGRSDAYYKSVYYYLEEYLWTYFFERRTIDFQGKTVATQYILNSSILWNRKLDMIESTLEYLNYLVNCKTDGVIKKALDDFVSNLNYEFKRLCFAYRVVELHIVEITSEDEIKAVETAVDNSADNIKMHFSEAIKLYSLRPSPDARNSIKESISAVEAFCREITGVSTLGAALKKMINDKGIVIPEILKISFEKLYAYTNNPGTGIRHSLMGDEGKYVPSCDEAYFMLVACSAFVNYLRIKISGEFSGAK